MTDARPILYADIERLAEVDAPDLVDAILAFVAQGEPEVVEPAPDDLVTLGALQAQLTQAAKAFGKPERRAQAHASWKRYLAQSPERVAPQMKLADLIERLYEKRSGPSRLALVRLAREAPLVFGIWGGLKRVYKRAEADHDAEIFGALAARFDTAHTTPGGVQRGTLVYLQRRAWRYLRLLGNATPELYPDFAVEVLRSYPLGTPPYMARVANRIQSHRAPKWGGPKGLAKDKRFRAPYLDAWKRSPDPLMLLLETCEADLAASFAITGLRELFPDVIRKVTPEWLGRLAFRPLPAAHTFLVELLEGSPELHQGKLASLGLHEPVLALLLSPSPAARKYAIEYARGHASDLPTERLIALLESQTPFDDTNKFVAAMLSARGGRALGVEVVGRLVGFFPTKNWAGDVLTREFEPKEITDEFLAGMLLSGNGLRSQWAQWFINTKRPIDAQPLAFFMRVLDDPALARSPGIAQWAVARMAKAIPVRAAPGDWILEALGRQDIGAAIAVWLGTADALPVGIDLERIKGLVFDPSRREVAFTLLGQTKLVSPGDVGLGWLLALARRADPRLHEWAHRYLLEHMRPEHFADGKPEPGAGVARLFGLALGPKEPEAVRAFAQTFLRCHHPAIGKDEPESKQFDIKPAIARTEYSKDRIWPALFDARGDVRRFAVAITRSELRRWGAQADVYELAESSAKEVRRVAYDALQQAGEPHAEPDLALRPEELDAAQIFSMTESRSRSSRDVAIELIRKHYGRIGGAERLGWLMQSADREVRAFAVRLLWEKHRPRGLPTDWKPKRGAIESAGAFKDAEALRDLLRRLLFTIPPGRSMGELEGARAKKLPTGVAKRNLVEIVRDLGIEDRAFAELVAPVLAAQTGSKAKGEWQACLSALMTLRSAHGIAAEELV